MPYVHATDTIEAHGSRFTPFANPTLGSTELCVWRVQIPADTTGVSHSLNHEEVITVLDGEVQFRLDEDKAVLRAGEAVIVPAGHTMAVDTHTMPATILAITKVDVHATMADGTSFTPPWSL